jgi:hypothetical protein
MGDTFTDRHLFTPPKTYRGWEYAGCDNTKWDGNYHDYYPAERKANEDFYIRVRSLDPQKIHLSGEIIYRHKDSGLSLHVEVHQNLREPWRDPWGNFEKALDSIITRAQTIKNGSVALCEWLSIYTLPVEGY